MGQQKTIIETRHDLDQVLTMLEKRLTTKTAVEDLGEWLEENIGDLNYEQVCKMLGCSRPFVDRLVYDGKLPRKVEGKKIRFSPAKVFQLQSENVRGRK